MPDANSSSLDLGLATEGASVLGVLADFNFLHHFPEGSTIADPVLPEDPDLLGLNTDAPWCGYNRHILLKFINAQLNNILICLCHLEWRLLISL